MDFASPEDLFLAALSSVCYLPALLRAFEDGLRALGLEILERSHFLDKGGNACPVLVVRGARLRLRLELRGAFEELLSADGDARPLKVDRQLLNDTYAREKLAQVVSGRLEIVKALEESRSLEDAQKRLMDLGERFEWLRVVFEEEPR